MVTLLIAAFIVGLITWLVGSAMVARESANYRAEAYRRWLDETYPDRTDSWGTPPLSYPWGLTDQQIKAINPNDKWGRNR